MLLISLSSTLSFYYYYYSFYPLKLTYFSSSIPVFILFLFFHLHLSIHLLSHYQPSILKKILSSFSIISLVFLLINYSHLLSSSIIFYSLIILPHSSISYTAFLLLLIILSTFMNLNSIIYLYFRYLKFILTKFFIFTIFLI